jgi:hypothetical protein
MKNKKIPFRNSYQKIFERGKIDTLIKQIHDQLLSWFGTGSTIKSTWDKLVSWAKL